MRKILRVIAALIALALFCVSAWQIWGIASEYSAADEAYRQAAQQFVQTVPVPATEPPETQTESDRPTEESTAPTEPPEYAPISVDFSALWEVNEYVVGWIYCPDTVISYPIVQTDDNSDFLRRMLDGSYNRSGTIFLDYRNNSDFTSLNSIIYGHNMNNSSMFGSLENYKMQEYYDAHPTFYLLTPQADYRVDLIAGLNLPADSTLYRTDHTAESFNEFLDTVCSKSTFASAVAPEEVSRTLTLSTCSYDFENARYILVGALTQLDRPEAP